MTPISKPTFVEEKYLWDQGLSLIAGVDEVGRGCFAGPIVASAVILPLNFSAVGEINDSKLLTSNKRKELSQIIKKEAIHYAISEVSVSYINNFGVGKANHLAFRKAIKKLSVKPDYLLVDGFIISKYPRSRQKAIIKGDRISISIASASILAKVYRDEIMQNLPKIYQRYGFAENKGYGTGFHRQAIFNYGLSNLHRTSFNLQKFLSAN